MTDIWLANAKHYNLTATRGWGDISNRLLGAVLHVNESELGTPDSFWSAGTDRNPDSVCPNVQVYKNGDIHQMLPLNWGPWCQRSGDFTYGAMETAGFTTQALTEPQLASLAYVMRVYHEELGVPLLLANQPGQPGIGTHAMGGEAWGGHPCPGTIRTAQRARILELAGGDETIMDNEIRARFDSIDKQLDNIVRRQQIELFGRNDDPSTPQDEHVDGLEQVMEEVKKPPVS